MMVDSYDTQALRTWCDENDMPVDEGALQNSVDLFAEYDAPQELFDRATVFHASTVKHYFTPGSWSMWSRFKLAARFLFA